MISIEQKVSEPSLKVFYCSPCFYFRALLFLSSSFWSSSIF